jgi:type IV secretion system protein VirD4
MAFSVALGVEWNLWTNRKGRRAVRYTQNRHVTIFGPTRSGKGVCLEIPWLLRLKGLSIISIDPKGQNRAVTGRWRKSVGKVVDLNPLDVLGLGSSGFNPLARLDPTSPHFFQHCSAIAEALISIADGRDPFFDISARNLILALIMWEVTSARAEGRAPLLKHVRGMLTGDLPATAKQIFESGDFQMASLAGQFMEKNRTNDGIVATAASKTQWLLSQPMLDDLEKDGIDFARLKQEAITVYVILPAHALETFSAWLRLVVACAFNALYRQEGGGGLRTLFLLSEFAQLGKLSMVSAALAQGAGYGIQLCPVLQDINQLRAIYGRDQAETFLGMSGATVAFCPNDGETAEWMSRRSGEVIEPALSASDDPQQGARASWRGERRRLLPPGDLHNIPEFHGLVFFAGRSAPQPVFAPPYWDAQRNPDLQGRYDPDPYHAGSGGGAGGKLLKLIRYPALLAMAAVIAGALLALPALHRQTGEAVRAAAGKMDDPAAFAPRHVWRHHATR